MKNLNIKPIATIAAMFVVVFGLFAAGFFARGVYDDKQANKVSSVGEEFVASVVAGDAEKAYSLMSADFQERNDKQMFTETVNQLKTDNPEMSESKSAPVGDTVAYYQQVGGLKENAAGKTEVDFMVTLSEVDGKWQVSDATLQ